MTSDQQVDSFPSVSMELLHEIHDAFNSRDADAIAVFFADDATFFMASGPDVNGRAIKGKSAIRKVLADRFLVIPDMSWDWMYGYTAGDRAVTVWRVTGNADDGTVLDFQGCDLWEFRDGLVLNKDTYWKIVK
ncbi:MAG TPA: nuclear transport factor 2 family protein [Acidimicrobiales bacterium]|nr:nuclear transport factor 2 family protein [Acidimicrobiales bacterium]